MVTKPKLDCAFPKWSHMRFLYYSPEKGVVRLKRINLFDNVLEEIERCHLLAFLKNLHGLADLFFDFLYFFVRPLFVFWRRMRYGRADRGWSRSGCRFGYLEFRRLI